jgi:Flp pilus assembly protein TadD
VGDRRGLLVIVGLVLVLWLTWAGALGNGFAWDDRQLVVENASLTAPGAWIDAFRQDFWESELTAGRSSYYRPLVTWSYIADRAQHGLDPRGFHATNLLIHFAAVLLLWRLLRDWGLDTARATLGAAWFGVHPVLAECVAWVAGRTDPIATVFLLITWIADVRRDRAIGRWGARLALAAALASKEIAVVGPLVAVIADVGVRPWREAVRRRADLFAILAAYFGVRAAVLGSPVSSGGLQFPAEVLAAAPLHFIGLTLLPGTGRVEYGLGLPFAAIAASAAVGAVIVAGLGLAAKRSSDPLLRRLVLAGLVACVPMGLSIGLKGVLGERLVYLPAAVLLPAMVCAGWNGMGSRLAPLMFTTAAMGSAWATVAKVPAWVSERTLFERAMSQEAPSARTRINYGIALHDDGELRRARELLEGAWAEARTREGAYMLGLLYTEIGCPAQAEPWYREALALQPADAAAANNLAGLFIEQGLYTKARATLDAALATGRTDARLRQNRASLETEVDAPIPVSSPCVSPAATDALLGDVQRLTDRAVALLKQRNLEAARTVLRAARQLDPGSVRVRMNEAQYYILSEQPEKARPLLQGILTEQPNHAAARHLLGLIPATP